MAGVELSCRVEAQDTQERDGDQVQTQLLVSGPLLLEHETDRGGRTVGFCYAPHQPSDDITLSETVAKFRLSHGRSWKCCCTDGEAELNSQSGKQVYVCQPACSSSSLPPILPQTPSSIGRMGLYAGAGSCKVTEGMERDGKTEVDQLPCLQRLFLSCNSITRQLPIAQGWAWPLLQWRTHTACSLSLSTHLMTAEVKRSFDELACLGESGSLSELTLDGNPVALETWYKQAALRCVLQLRQLDMKREEERRMACVMARKEDEKRRESHKQAMHKSPAHVAPQQFYTQLGLKSQDSAVTSKAGGISLSVGCSRREMVSFINSSCPLCALLRTNAN
ncbi:unnamed protein product [Coregonus sp. 'balchen']|nr:unnamed protein product [Coregonus sp. 'balchen']